MTGLVAALQRVQQALSEAGIESVAIGALALSVWGRARATSDVDLKILLPRERGAYLLDSLPGYTPMVEEPVETLRRLGFLFLRGPEGCRVDLLLADTAYDEQAIHRAVEMEVLPGQKARVCTAEDLVIYKLISTRLRDHEDAGTVVLRQGSALDAPYVEGWLRQFELALDDSTLVDTFRGMLRAAG